MSTRSERFQALYEAHHSRVLGFALRRTRDPADAHDVVAETFLVAWRRLDDVPEGERTRLWLYGTARRVMANQRRSRSRQERLADRLAAQEATTVLPLDPGEDWSEVTAAFAALDDADREILLLAGWEELDAGQIAEVLGCARVTARVRLHRARRRFADLLDASGVRRPAASGSLTPARVFARPDAEEPL